MGPQSRSLSLRLLPITWLVGIVVADIQPCITTIADVNTECKTCPHSLCPNVIVYEQEEGYFNVTCWTRGTKIMGDNLWLKSEAGCYVTQYDVQEWAGDYTTDLKYCGRASEDEHITIEDHTVKYKTECNINPEIASETWAYLLEDTDVTLTCWTDKGAVIIDDPVWLKTTNNCYVAEKNLYSKPDITYLDNCGPMIYLETEKHWNENGTSEIDKRSLFAPERAALGTNYLVNVTIGEDHANCRSCPKESCGIDKRYVFNQEVWLQCVVVPDPETVNGTYWSETTDFCYVRSQDFWESPEGDFYKFPRCSAFEGGDPGDDDKAT